MNPMRRPANRRDCRGADRARKNGLVEHWFRIPQRLDTRPLDVRGSFKAGKEKNPSC